MSINKNETVQQESEKLQISALETDSTNQKSGEQLVERTKIEHTPFHLIGDTDHGYFISLGKYRLTEPKETKEEALELLEDEPWNIILTMQLCIHESLK